MVTTGQQRRTKGVLPEQGAAADAAGAGRGHERTAPRLVHRGSQIA